MFVFLCVQRCFFFVYFYHKWWIYVTYLCQFFRFFYSFTLLFVAVLVLIWFCLRFLLCAVVSAAVTVIYNDRQEEREDRRERKRLHVRLLLFSQQLYFVFLAVFIVADASVLVFCLLINFFLLFVSFFAAVLQPSAPQYKLVRRSNRTTTRALTITTTSCERMRRTCAASRSRFFAVSSAPLPFFIDLFSHTR